MDFNPRRALGECFLRKGNEDPHKVHRIRIRISSGVNAQPGHFFEVIHISGVDWHLG